LFDWAWRQVKRGEDMHGGDRTNGADRLGMVDSTDAPGRFDDPVSMLPLVRREGFPGQRMRTLPRPLVAALASKPPFDGILVTDAGYFPHAAGHGRARPFGAEEAIVIFCTDGRGTCTADREVEIERSTAVVIPPRLQHTYRSDTHDPWTIWWLHITGQHVTNYLQALNAVDRVAVIDVYDRFRLSSAIEDVIARLELDDARPTLVTAGGLATVVLSALVAEQGIGSLRNRAPVDAVVDHLRQHYDRPVSVTSLAAKTGLSTSHFCAQFRKTTGRSVVQYVKRHRIARASELLLTTDLAIGDIGERVGYRDPFYFSRQFRGVHGCSPSAYRKRYGHVLAPS
jgi:AraC-like DNA-binding protein